MHHPSRLPLLLLLSASTLLTVSGPQPANADPAPLQISLPEPGDPGEGDLPGGPTSRRRPAPRIPRPDTPGPGTATGPPTPLDAPLARGEIVRSIVSPGDPTRAYALYLPSNYDPARRWPIVYLLDARGGALWTVNLFRAGAEKYGYVLASAYDSASDVATDPNVAAVNAMWSDTHLRLALDDRRIYLAGFSGTVRSSCAIATSVPGKVTGIIGASAGWPPALVPDRQTSFLFFGTAGDRDFNFEEMLALDSTLARLELTHRIELFPGPHSWMPQELATASLAWMEAQAMRAGIREKDPALVAAIWNSELERARALEAAGHRLDAWRLYDGAARDFEGLTDVAAARKEADRLSATRQVLEERRGREARRSRDLETLRQARAVLDALWTTDAAESRRLIRMLPIALLRNRAERHKGEEEGLSAERLLAALYGQTAFYMPSDADERGSYAKAALFLSIATEIRPESPHPWGHLAAERARLGDRAGSLAALKRSLELGYEDRAGLAADPGFDTLRDDPGFRALLGEPAPAPTGARP